MIDSELDKKAAQIVESLYAKGKKSSFYNLKKDLHSSGFKSLKESDLNAIHSELKIKRKNTEAKLRKKRANPNDRTLNGEAFLGFLATTLFLVGVVAFTIFAFSFATGAMSIVALGYTAGGLGTAFLMVAAQKALAKSKISALDKELDKLNDKINLTGKIKDIVKNLDSKKELLERKKNHLRGGIEDVLNRFSSKRDTMAKRAKHMNEIQNILKEAGAKKKLVPKIYEKALLSIAMGKDNKELKHFLYHDKLYILSTKDKNNPVFYKLNTENGRPETVKLNDSINYIAPGLNYIQPSLKLELVVSEKKPLTDEILNSYKRKNKLLLIKEGKETYVEKNYLPEMTGTKNNLSIDKAISMIKDIQNILGEKYKSEHNALEKILTKLGNTKIPQKGKSAESDDQTSLTPKDINKIMCETFKIMCEVMEGNNLEENLSKLRINYNCFNEDINLQQNKYQFTEEELKTLMNIKPLIVESAEAELAKIDAKQGKSSRFESFDYSKEEKDLLSNQSVCLRTLLGEQVKIVKATLEDIDTNIKDLPRSQQKGTERS